MRSSCRAEHFTIGGRNDTTDNVFGADVFVAKILKKYYISNTKHFDEFLTARSSKRSKE